jgi:hypothetical protein
VASTLDRVQHNRYVVFVLPEFTEDGLLPEGLHRSTWDEVVARFGCSARRRRLLAGLQEAATNLRDAGARYLWLDGGFTTAKADPDDFDCAWDPSGVNLGKVDPVLTDPEDLRTGRYRQKAKYGGEFWSALRGVAGCRTSCSSNKTRMARLRGSYCWS